MSPRDCRCACGALIARRTGTGIELKCRRCKRVWSLKTDDFSWNEAAPFASSGRQAGQRPQRPEPLP
jgi:phage FluMu protein Com